MGLLNRAVAAVWRLPQTIANQGQVTAPEPLGERIIYIGRSPAGVWVTPDEALKLSTVWACVSVISKALASCPWEVLEEDQQGNRTPLRNMLWWRLNKSPNPEMTAFSFREAMLVQALVWGNAYAEIDRNRRGDPVEMYPLSPERCQLVRGNENELLLEVQNMSRPPVYLDYRDVYHIHGPSISGIEGLPIVHYAARTFGHAAAAEIFGGTFYGNGTQMGGILSTDGSLSEQQKTDLLKSINDRHSGPENANKFMLLQGGLKFQQLAPTQEQSQFIETRMLLVEEIARFFGVPPHKVGHLQRSTNNNIEHQGLEFVRDAITPWAERLSQEADTKLMPFGNRLMTTRFDLDWLSEGDARTRAEADAQYVGSGILTRNEVRRAHGWNQRPEADTLTTQVQYRDIAKVDELADAEIAKTKQEAKPPPAPVIAQESAEPDEDPPPRSPVPGARKTERQPAK